MKLIKWNRDCIKYIPTTEGAKPIILLKGINEVSDEAWKFAKKHVEDSIERKDIEVVSLDEEITTTVVDEKTGKEKKVTNKKDVQTIADIPVKKAIALVNETINPMTFAIWQETEIRPEVRHAILKRMTALKLEESTSAVKG